jgi:hypothetical protein
MYISWIKSISTCFGHHYALHQENKNKTGSNFMWRCLVVLAVIVWSRGVGSVHFLKAVVWMQSNNSTWQWVVNATPWPLYPRERYGNHGIGGWVGPRAGAENSPPQGFDPRTIQAVARLMYVIQYKPTKRTFSTHKTVYTDAGKTYHSVTVHTTVFLKMNTWVRYMQKT